MFGNNRKVTQFYKEAKKDLKTAKTNCALLNIVQKAIDFDGDEIRYDNRLYYIIISILALTTTFHGVEIHEFNLVHIIIYVVCFFAFMFIYSRNGKLAKLATQIYDLDALFDNGIKRLQNPSISAFEEEFNGFHRGNYKREIQEYNQGDFDEHESPYFYFKFHYVNRRVESYSVTVNGKTEYRTRTVYDDFYRYGFIIDFEGAKNIQVESLKFEKRYMYRYRTSSIEFNKIFKVFCDDDMEASKFLKPAVIVALEDLSKELRNLNIEIGNKNRMCISFSNDDIMKSVKTREFGFEDPYSFYEELSQEAILARLEKILDFFIYLKKHS